MSVASVLSGGPFMPHGHCYLWEPGLVALQVISNTLIALAYVVIAIMLAILVYRGRYLPFKGMAAAFGVFIISCGLTHFMDVVVIWNPVYWVDGAVRGVTAVASVGTALLLPPLIPKAISLARGARAAHERGTALEAMVEELETLYAKTRELDQLKSDFFANVSHELRTPLTLILGPAERMREADNLSESQRRDIEVILRNGRTLHKHVNDLLDIARLEQARLEPVYEEVDVSRLVARGASHFEVLARDRASSFVVETPESAPATIDVDKIERIVLNLLSNAFKFSPPGETIRCSLQVTDERLRIEVADSGPGIPADRRTAVFGRFRQVDSGSTRAHEGTGLGLAIVKDFAELHGGAAGIEEAPEGGALVWVDIPRWPGDEVTVRAPRRDPEAPISKASQQALEELERRLSTVAPESVSERPPVLVVEDNPEMNRFIAETLGERYHVTRAFNGQEALEAVETSAPDLVVTDIMMPKMSGDELVRALRERQDTRNLPIIVLSARADDLLRVELLEEGAQDYLTKPFSSAELLARVSNLITMKRSRDVLQREVSAQVADLEALSLEVTDRKRELQTALEAMRVARERAEQANQLKSDFLNMVSHELRTPLTSLGLQLSMLERSGQSVHGKGGAMVERMRRSTERLTQLIDSLLHYARLESDRRPEKYETIVPRSLVESVAEELRQQAYHKGLELVVRQEGDPGELTTDPEMLQTVLRNLLGNAIKYTEEGRVELVVSQRGQGDGGEHLFEVRDTGIGIPEEMHDRVFEPFEQLEQIPHKHAPGVGLGLAIVRELVQALGGAIGIQSQSGRGSSFTVRIPSDEPTRKNPLRRG